MSHSSVKMRAAAQLPAVGPEDDLTGMLLQVGFSDEIHMFFFMLHKFYSDTLHSFAANCNGATLPPKLTLPVCPHASTQIFPLKVDPRWPGPAPSQLSLALQQALAKDLMRAKQGQIQQGGLAFQLLQAIAALLTSAHARPIVMSMHCSHALSCPLMRQLHLYQVALQLTAACFHLDSVSRLISGAYVDRPAAPRVPGCRLLLAVH